MPKCAGDRPWDTLPLGYRSWMTGSTKSAALRFVGVSLDCADPAELATFYLSLLGGRLLWGNAESAGVQVPGVVLVMQRVRNYRRPRWPDASIVHLDLWAGDRLDEPEQQAIALGAELVDPQPDTRWRVLLDPAGHPFCITTLRPPPDMVEPSSR